MKVLRYAQLILKRTCLEKRHMGSAMTHEETTEIETIPRELGKTHEEILELAAKNLIPENGC